jgi:hypothetical protein
VLINVGRTVELYARTRVPLGRAATAVSGYQIDEPPIVAETVANLEHRRSFQLLAFANARSWVLLRHTAITRPPGAI